MPPWDVIGQGGMGAILAGVAWLVFTGRLVPRKTLTDAHEERDRWREVALKAMDQNGSLVTGARVTHDVLRALPDVARDVT